MTTTLTIDDRASLGAARRVIDADEVTLVTARLKSRNLLPTALRFAFWAVRPGGRIVIRDDSPSSPGPDPFDLTMGLVRQWIFRFIGAGCSLVELTSDRVVLQREAPVLAPGWAAGVVFSGNDGEIPTLRACLAGLVRQPELAPSAGGEIAVCGPTRDLTFLDDFPTVRYVPFETPPGPRFLIGAKKNHLMAALGAPRMVILHARVVLGEGALGVVPREFDMASPDTRVATPRGPKRYLSLVHTDTVWPGVLPRTATTYMRNIASGDPLEMIEKGDVFVDGGAFYVTRPVFEACPMNPLVAWNEGEDIEWCGRLLACGYVSELVAGSDALSQTSKLNDWSRLGGAEILVRNVVVAGRTLRGFARHTANRLRGRR